LPLLFVVVRVKPLFLFLLSFSLSLFPICCHPSAVVAVAYYRVVVLWLSSMLSVSRALPIVVLGLSQVPDAPHSSGLRMSCVHSTSIVHNVICGKNLLVM